MEKYILEQLKLVSEALQNIIVYCQAKELGDNLIKLQLHIIREDNGKLSKKL